MSDRETRIARQASALAHRHRAGNIEAGGSNAVATPSRASPIGRPALTGAKSTDCIRRTGPDARGAAAELIVPGT
jgi:hypothetical protein